MKKMLIRTGVFETNSSSCHSISVADNTKPLVLDTVYPDLNGKITIQGGEYGRGVFSRHNDVKTKLSYALTSTLYGLDEHVLKEVIEEQTGCNNIEFLISDDYKSPYYSYIDHESYDIVPQSKEDLRNFLFNKNSWLFIAHDEGVPPPNFYDALPLHLENGTVVEPEYKFMFEIPSLDIQYKLLEYPNEDQLNNIVESINVRYNATKGCLEQNNDYWSSRESYYEFDYDYLVDLDKKIIILVNRYACDKQELEEVASTNNILSWDESSELRKNIIKQNLNNTEMVYQLSFNLIKL